MELQEQSSEEHRAASPARGENSVLSRLLALTLVPAYLYFVAWLLAMAAGARLTETLPAVTAGATVIMAVLAAFGLKAFRQRGPVRQFGLSSLFLLVVPLAVYFAAIGWVARSAANDERLRHDGWSVVIMGSIIIGFMVFTTVLLLWLAEALVWTAVLIVRPLRGHRTPRCMANRKADSKDESR